MKKFLNGLLAALVVFTVTTPVLAIAADVVPLVLDVGKTRRMATGETVGLAHGGTGATDAAGARTALSVQASDAELSALAGLTSAADKVPYFTGSGTAALADLSSYGRSLIDDADAAAARTTLGLVIGTNVQAYDADLTTYAGITPSANVQTLLGSANYSAFRSSLGLGTFATQSAPTGSTQCLHADSSGNVTGTGADCGAGAGTVTTTGSPANGNLAKFSGAASIVNGDLSGDVTTSGTLATTIASNAVTTAKILNANVTLAKIANASASSKLLGSGASGSGAAYSEITLGTGLTMTGTTLSTGSGSGDFIKIGTVTTAGSQTSITFSSIPGTYTHLKIVGQLRGGSTDSAGMVQFNTDTNKSNYTATQLQGSGGGASSNTFAAGNTFANIIFDMPSSAATANAVGAFEAVIPNYSGTTFFKSWHSSSGNPSGNVKETGGHWANTAAITQVTLVTQNGQAFANGLVITLYGLN